MDGDNYCSQKDYLHLGVFFLILILGWTLPPVGLPEMGMKICAIFIALLYGWTFIGFSWPSMICILALGFSGYGEASKIISGAFSHPVVIFTIFVLVFTKYCDKSGLNECMAKWLISRSAFVGRPWLFSSCVLVGTLVIGFLIDGVPAVFLISSLLYAIFRDIGYKQGDKFPAYILAGVCIAGVLSFACKPWMGQNILGIQALTDISHGSAHIGNLMLIMTTFPVCVAALLVYVLAIRCVFKPDIAPLKALSNDYLEKIRTEIAMGPEQKLAACFLSLFLAFMLLPNILPARTAIGAFFGKFSITVAITLILAILSFITVKRRKIFDFQACSNGINWNVIWMLASSIPVSAALSSDGAGIARILTESLQSLSFDGSSIMFVCVFTLMASLITQITHNVTIVLVGVPLIWNLAPGLGINPEGFALMLFLGSGAAFATPAASTVGALSFANGEWIGMKNAFTAGFVGWIATLLCIFILGMPLINIMVGL